MTSAKHTAKRRKLSQPSSSNRPSSDYPIPTAVLQQPRMITTSNVQKLNIPNPQCAFCHRSLNATQALILCCRCSTSTCVVCSRTCNASVPSIPPTPHLVWSSTPSPTIPSPRRIALALNTANTNLGTDVAPTGGTSIVRKRRNYTDDDRVSGERKIQQNSLVRAAAEEEQDLIAPGCGRVVCRNCCIENSQINTITCYDCCGR